jgi:flagellar motor switch protein FliN/FliY
MNDELNTPGGAPEEELPDEIQDILRELEAQAEQRDPKEEAAAPPPAGDEAPPAAPPAAAPPAGGDAHPSEPPSDDPSVTGAEDPGPDPMAGMAEFAMEQLAKGAGSATGEGQPIDMLMDVDLNVRIELGRSKMTIQDILHLADGSVITLDKLAGDPLNIYVNNRLVAKGEVLVLNENFCIRITEIVEPSKRLEG